MIAPEFVLAYDCRTSSFFRSRAMSEVAHAIGSKGGNLKSLLGAGTGTDIVRSPKCDGTLRPGSHLHPADAIRWADIACQLVPYVRAASARLVGKGPVAFAHLLRSDEDRISARGLFRRDGWDRMVAKTKCGYVSGNRVGGTVDGLRFYEHLTSEMLVAPLDGVGAPAALIERIVQFVDQQPQGLPQGSSTSDLLASIFLIPVHEDIRRCGPSVVSFSDDFRLAGCSRLNVGRDTVQLIEILADHGVPYNFKKQRVHDGKAAMLLLLAGIDVSDVDLDGYGSESIMEIVEQGLEQGYGQGWNKRPGVVANSVFDFEVLYEAEFAAGRNVRSEHLMRWCFRRGMPVIRPLVARDLEFHVTDPSRQFFISHLLCLTQPFEWEGLIGEWCLKLAKDHEFVASQILDNRGNWSRHRGAARCASQILQGKPRTMGLRRACYETLSDEGNPTDLMLVAGNWALEEWEDQQASIIFAMRRLPKDERHRFYDVFKRQSAFCASVVRLCKDAAA